MRLVCSIFAHVGNLESHRIGQRIAEARGRARLTQAELATTVSIDRSSLAKIEKGARRVTALELARIADAVNARIEWFVQEAPPSIVSRRNLQDPGAPSPAMDDFIERVARNVEFATAQDSPFVLDSPAPLDHPGSADEAENAASRARELLGFEPSAPALELAECASRVGLLIFAFDLGADSADGACMLLQHGGIALVNGTLHVGRRRLTAAHELGHYLFADEFTVDWQVAEDAGSDQREARLDRFARAVLLPATGITREWMSLQESGDDLRVAAVKIASRFRVDMSTLARRLLELNMIDAAAADQVRSVRTRKADIVEFNLVNSDELATPCLPRAYIESVLRLYRAETVSAARATDLLLDTWDEDDLPPLPNLPHEAIWQFVS